MPYKDPEAQREYKREYDQEARATSGLVRKIKLPGIEAKSLAEVRAAILFVMNEVRSGENPDLPRARFTINALAELRETFRAEKEIELNERLEAIEAQVALLATGYALPVAHEETVIALPVARGEQAR